jgi:NAD(P)-dependent dehydrogenase (short-subunit alcohol dehydrogenase family)
MLSPDLQRLFDLEGRVALITGGSRGLGLEMARGLSGAGAKLVIASRKAGELEAAAEQLRTAGADVLAVPCNMGEVDQVRALVDRTMERFGRLDILINNAGNPLVYDIHTATEAAFDKSFAVNAKGPLFLMQAAAPHLKASPSAQDPNKSGASIINVLTVGAFRGLTNQLGYGASKAALWHMTRSAARNLAVDRIRVNAIAPGALATLMVTSGGPALMEKSAEGAFQKRVADPKEIIGPALFLASDASSFMTGAVLTYDGGYLA